MSESLFPERTDRTEIEEGEILRPKFDEHGLIPCITVDDASGDVLMVAYMNDEALARTLETRRATYYSRSRGKLWVKGEESGLVQQVKDVYVDCDQDVILLRVDVAGEGCCHQGYRSCFYRRVKDPAARTLEFTGERVFDPKSVYKK